MLRNTSKIKYLIFTKNRPLQLTALLESFYYFTNGAEENTIIIYKGNSYGELKTQYININWINQDEFKSFDECVKFAINHYIKWDDILLMMVDDLVWFRPFNLSILNAHYDISSANSFFGISLRLGTNIHGFNHLRIVDQKDAICVWDWTKSASHWGYPFSISADAFLGRDIQDIILSGEFRIPNDIESHGVHYCVREVNKHVSPYNACLRMQNFCACMDINRVQDLYPNKINTTQDTSAEVLLRIYRNGERINWKKAINCVETDCFIGSKYFELESFKRFDS